MFSKKLLLPGLILLFISNAYAVNFQYLRYSPIASFTSEDFELFENAGYKALNDNKDGQGITWENPETKNSGTITPLNTSTIDGMFCRKVKITNQSKNRYNESSFTFCKKEGNWKVLK